MDRDCRLLCLIEALLRISGREAASADATIGQLGLDSRHLVDVVFACEDIYGEELDFAKLDIQPDTSLQDLHRRIVSVLSSADQAERGAPN